MREAIIGKRVDRSLMHHSPFTAHSQPIHSPPFSLARPAKGHAQATSLRPVCLAHFGRPLVLLFVARLLGHHLLACQLCQEEG